MKENIFTQIMDLIEKNTDIPILEKDIDNWILKDEKNVELYEIYIKASNSRF